MPIPMLYYVYQKDKVVPAVQGGYIWSHRNLEEHQPGFELMRELQPGDFILHSHKAHIAYISVVEEAFKYAWNSPRMEDEPRLDNCTERDAKGYYVPVRYYPLQNPLVMRWHRAWLRQHHCRDSAFDVRGSGIQRYLCHLAPEHAVYLLKECINKRQCKETEAVLRAMLACAERQL